MPAPIDAEPISGRCELLTWSNAHRVFGLGEKQRRDLYLLEQEYYTLRRQVALAKQYLDVVAENQGEAASAEE